jgi:hypothetical protein
MQKTFHAHIKLDEIRSTPAKVSAASLWEAREKLEGEYGEGTVTFLKEKDGSELFEADIRRPGLAPMHVEILGHSQADAREKLELMYGKTTAYNVSEPNQKIHAEIGRIAIQQLSRKGGTDQICPTCGGRVSVLMDDPPYWFSVACPCGRCNSYHKDI